MAQHAIPGNEKLAKQIKSRRIELGLTIEEAASRAGVGTKSWSRYEAGESIRKDKCRGICKALNWLSLPDSENDIDTEKISLLDQCRGHEAWSSYLANTHGKWAAVSFAIGSDLLLDKIKQDLTDLSSMPAGTHIGQLGTSMIAEDLPEQFLMEYDYNFLYQMKCSLLRLRAYAHEGVQIVAHSVLEELIIYLCNESAIAYTEIVEAVDEADDLAGDQYFEEWIFDMFGDMDIVTWLYSDMYVDEGCEYHFSHWGERVFYGE